jgi:hypothetical protein
MGHVKGTFVPGAARHGPLGRQATTSAIASARTNSRKRGRPARFSKIPESPKGGLRSA